MSGKCHQVKTILLMCLQCFKADVIIQNFQRQPKNTLPKITIYTELTGSQMFELTSLKPDSISQPQSKVQSQIHNGKDRIRTDTVRKMQ